MNKILSTVTITTIATAALTGCAASHAATPHTATVHVHKVAVQHADQMQRLGRSAGEQYSMCLAEMGADPHSMRVNYAAHTISLRTNFGRVAFAWGTDRAVPATYIDQAVIDQARADGALDC